MIASSFQHSCSSACNIFYHLTCIQLDSCSRSSSARSGSSGILTVLFMYRNVKRCAGM